MGEPKPPRQSTFWHTQPVVQLGSEHVEAEGIILYQTEEVGQDPHALARGFSWCTIDIGDPAQLDELYQFLRANYVVHPSNPFRFAYTSEFLKWALDPPGTSADWRVAVRQDSTNRLVAFISAVPCTVRIKDDVIRMVAVDFLSVHQKLRGRSLAPLMIKEVTRRVNVEGIFQAIYTVGREVTKPLTSSIYRHRMINMERLVRVGFTQIPQGSTLEREKKRLATRAQGIPGWRPMQPVDVGAVTEKLNAYLSSFEVAQVFTPEEVAWWFLPRPGVVGSYVVEGGKKSPDPIESFFAFFMVPSNVTPAGGQTDSFLAAYGYYYFAPPSKLIDVARAAIDAAAREWGADVFNLLDVVHNKELVGALKFVEGDGRLHYYLYGYAKDPVKPEKVAVVLL